MFEVRKVWCIMKNRKICYMVPAVILFIAIITIMAGFKANAQDKKIPEGVYKYYRTIEVNSGDTLWSIADKYADSSYISKENYINEIKKINNISGDTIHSGSYLTISYYSEEFK